MEPCLYRKMKIGSGYNYNRGEKVNTTKIIDIDGTNKLVDSLIESISMYKPDEIVYITEQMLARAKQIRNNYYISKDVNNTTKTLMSDIFGSTLR